MADLTAVTTFVPTVFGNERVIHCDVSSAGFTTSDTVLVPLTAIIAISNPRWRTTVWDAVASTVSVPPSIFVGAAANAVVIARSSLAALPLSFTVYGR